MSLQIAPLLLFVCIFVYTSIGQAVANDGLTLAELLGQATNPASDKGPAVANDGPTLAELLGQATNPASDKAIGPAVANDGPNLAELLGQVTNPASDKVLQQNNSPATAEPNLGNNNGDPNIPGTESCKCVPYYLCQHGHINKDDEGIIDIAVNNNQCDSYLEVCCSKGFQLDKPTTSTPPPEKKTGCGVRNPYGVAFRITDEDGPEAQFGEFPWMIAVLKEEIVEGNPNKFMYQCGGALIHPQIVVTTAHCVRGKDKTFKIRAGEWDTQTTQELYPHQDREVQNIVVHPQYYNKTLYNNIALLYLKTPLQLEENIQPVCLPAQGTVVDSATCFATGWGKGQEGKYQDILQKIYVPMVPKDKCQSKIRTTRLGKDFQLHESFVCAGGESGKNTCQPGEGSPLVCPIPGQTGRYYEIGISSWGIGCGENDIPHVYVNVPLFRDWIDTQMREFNLDQSAYKY